MVTRKKDLGIELFERAADADGRILKVEQLPLSMDEPDPSRGVGYLLIFDVGRILVAADPGTGSLAVKEIPAQATLKGDRLSIEEEEPWWRVVGCGLARCWPGAVGEGATGVSDESSHVCLQFRADEDNPRVISLKFDGGVVAVALEPTNGG
jgi:hypothetical protein